MKIEVVSSVKTNYTLINNRVYQITNTGEPYINQEYPTGGFTIKLFDRGNWVWIDQSPDADTVANFLRLATRLKPLCSD